MAPFSPTGLSFPTSLSLNNTVSHFSPLPSDKDIPVLKEGDVVKVMMGVHIDGVSRKELQNYRLENEPSL